MQIIAQKELDIKMNSAIVTWLAIVIPLILMTYVTSIITVNYWKYDAEEKRRLADLEMAKAQSLMMTAKPYKELVETLNAIIDFRIAHEMVLVITGTITREERDDILTNYTATISALIMQSLSKELLRQFAYYVEVNDNPGEDDYIKYYIRKNVMTKLAMIIDKRVQAIDDDKAKERKLKTNAKQSS